MYCKFEGKPKHYVLYSNLSKDHISDIVEIKFEGLKGNKFSGAAGSVDWSKLTKLRKIEGVDSDLNSYTFPENALSKLEEIKFTQCHLNCETLTSLLNAVPDIDSKKNFIFKWDEYSRITDAAYLEDSEAEVAAFELVSQRIQKIQTAQKMHGQNSVETTVPGEDLDEEIDLQSIEKRKLVGYDHSVSDDSDTNSVISLGSRTSNDEQLVARVISHTSTTASEAPLFGFYGEEDGFDCFSQTGTSHSDSELLEGHAVANDSRLSLENVSQLDRLYPSGTKSYKAGMLIDGDEESSVGSVQVRRFTEKMQDDQDAETLSTLSRGPNIDSGDSGSRRAVYVEPLEYLEDDEEEGNKSGLRAGGKQRTTHDLEDRSRSAARVEVLVTYHPSTSATSSLSTDIPLTQEEFNNLSKSERAQIKALVINGNGPDGPDVGDTIDWSGLSRLEGLRLKGVTVEQPLPAEISFAGLKRIYFENCGVDFSTFESFSKASPKLEEMVPKALYGLSISDNSWRDLNKSEKKSIRHTHGQENLYEPDFDSSIQFVGELEDDDLDPDSLSEGESPRTTVPLPLSLSFTRHPPRRREDNVGMVNDRGVFTGRHKSNVDPNGTTTHTSTLLPNQPPGQQKGHQSSRRRSSSLGHDNGRTSYGSMMLGSSRSRMDESRVDTGVRGNTITNMHKDVPSRASLYGGTRRDQSRNQSGFPESTGPARSNPVRQYKTRPEMVVENGAASRDYAKLCEDTDAALGLIKHTATVGQENYRLVEIEGGEAKSIVYKHGDKSFTPILDAYIDTVRVHKGWREVNTNISNEARAEIIIASLGIPPCPPDIDISNEKSKLGRAIREQFNQLKLADPEIYVRRIDR